MLAIYIINMNKHTTNAKISGINCDNQDLKMTTTTTMMRVHSADLHEHVVSEIGDCQSSGLFTDVTIRCREGEVLYAHRAVLAAVSPYLKALMLQGWLFMHLS